VLLDFGGTLDSEGLHWSTQFALSFEAAGVAVDRAALDRAFLDADQEIERTPGIETFGLEVHVRLQAQLMADALELATPGIAEEVARRFVARARRHLRRNVEVLGRYRSVLRFALVSNFTPNLPLIVRETGLEDVLDSVVCSDKVGLRKPDPEIFRLALADLGVDPERAAMVGDSLVSDIMPAKALGLTTVWIRGDRVFVGGDETAADHVVFDLPEAVEVCVHCHRGGRLGGGEP
jgi:putative hydrolase of the HAD superfamily